ncbi:hypothetical protein [Bacillus sp. B15-48]|uniref:hypothetical protein n=1 Tax=Bacillus sp. B15-48 TaxID=1548601 RepID=UPI0019401864|nr:hypothetical protein [Bacillus sp. B15-48]MBM4763440.1 hypothetical protein [Bacillus sp. B15-48]
MGAFQAGPFIIKFTSLFAIIAVLVTFFLLSKLLKKNHENYNKYIDVLINAVLVAVVVYKGSIVLLRPELWSGNLLAALTLTGSWREMMIGFGTASIYFAWKVKNEGFSLSLVRNGIVYGGIIYIISYWVLRTLFFLFFR